MLKDDDSDSEDDGDSNVHLSVRTSFLDEKTSAVHAIGVLCLMCSQAAAQYATNKPHSILYPVH